MAPLQGARILICVFSGGLRCAATTGYFLSTLRVELSTFCSLLTAHCSLSCDKLCHSQCLFPRRSFVNLETAM